MRWRRRRSDSGRGYVAGRGCGVLSPSNTNGREVYVWRKWVRRRWSTAPSGRPLAVVILVTWARWPLIQSGIAAARTVVIAIFITTPAIVHTTSTTFRFVSMITPPLVTAVVILVVVGTAIVRTSAAPVSTSVTARAMSIVVSMKVLFSGLSASPRTGPAAVAGSLVLVAAAGVLLLEVAPRHLFEPTVRDLVRAVHDAFQNQLFHSLCRSFSKCIVMRRCANR